MVPRVWADESRKTLVCIDAYHNGVPQGRIYSPCLGAESFSSLSQFLIKMEALLDTVQVPQSYTAMRTFSPVSIPPDSRVPRDIRNGTKATFEVQVIFRQHTSWQGIIVWLEQCREQSFRSVLELVMLMDSALRGV